MLEKVAQYHNDWLRIANSFLNNKSDAEDIVQEMYINIHKKKLEEIRYKDEINRYFVYKVIKNLALQFLKNKAKRPDKAILNNGIYESQIQHTQDDHHHVLIEIDKEIKTWSAYERTLFEIYMWSGLSLRDIAYGTDKKVPRKISRFVELSQHSVTNGTKISLTSLFHTIKNCKQRLKENINYE